VNGLISFILYIIAVTASGALAPGPMTFAVVSHGAVSGARGGLLFSVGHTLVELPLVILLALGLLSAANRPAAQLLVGTVGGIALLVFGALQVRGSLTPVRDRPGPRGIASRSPVVMGLFFSALNPFFIVWWLTVGGKLVLDALALASLAGVLLMYLAHVWMDYAWLAAVAHLSRVGFNVVGARGYRVLTVVFGGFLIYFGAAFLASALA